MGCNNSDSQSQQDLLIPLLESAQSGLEFEIVPE